MKYPFPTTPELLAITLGYKNGRLIADQVLPRLKPIGKDEFAYNAYGKDVNFTVPNTMVGRTGKVNAITWGSTRKTGETEEYGLDNPIPNKDIKRAQEEGRDIEGKSAERLTNILLLDREKRVADLVQDPATYAGNSANVAAGDKFSAADSNPIKYLREVLDTPLLRPNKIVMGRPAWNALCVNPSVVSAAQGNSGKNGVATAQRVAELLEIEEIIIGEARLNMARLGQNPDLQRIWGNNVALLYQDSLADLEDGMTFGFTVQTGNRQAGRIEDKDIGASGGIRVRVWEATKELITAPDAGFLLVGAA